MNELVPLIILVLVGPLLAGLLYWRFRESRLFLWIGVLVTVALAVWMGFRILEDDSTSVVELGTFIVFCLAAFCAFWNRLSGGNGRDKPQ